MVSLDMLDDLVKTHDCIILCCGGKIICGCSKQFESLSSLAEHISRGHNKITRDNLNKDDDEECLQEHFRKNFSFPQQHKNAVTITLPDDITCVCLSEHDIGVFSSNIRCHICSVLCDDLDSLNKHIASVHRMSHILVGHNILFEKPDASAVKPAFFCPMVKCKYNVAESFQRKHFKTFKLLKQHYCKVHASKEFSCSKCDQKFASKNYLDAHLKQCGTEFSCQECDKKFSSLESLQTHARRNKHKLSEKYLKVKQTVRDPALDKLSIIQNCPRPGKISIAPKPSPMHINAAIALSEMAAIQTFKPKADIGVQTDVDIWRHRRSCTPAESSHVSPSKKHAAAGHVTAETQTRTGNRKRGWRPCKVSSQVQTLGEFSVRAKKPRDDLMLTTETQCRMSPAKKMKIDAGSITTMTTMTSINTGLEQCYVDVDQSLQCDENKLLWPLKSHTNGTQTSPRIARIPIKTLPDDEDDSEADDLGLPGLESVSVGCDSKPKFGEIRQFSTETQTELDIFLDNYGDVERLLTTEMETQTHDGDDNLLLFANNYTQTGTEDFLSALMIGGDTGDTGDHRTAQINNNPFKLDYLSCSAETQTRLTGFQEQSLLLQIDNNQVRNTALL